MNNRELFMNAFENISPSEKLLERVINSRTAPIKRKSRLKKGIIIPAAVCFAACLGITAAAVTGNLDFDLLFGDRIKAADSELAVELVGKISSVKYSVSDDDYIVRVAGVTGGADSCCAVIEISRKDGTPVTEHFQNSTEYDNESVYWIHEGFDIKNSLGLSAELSAGGGLDTSISDNGNIIFTIEIEGDGSKPLNGKVIEAEGDTLVWINRYLEIRTETNSYYGMNKGEWGFFDNDTNEPVCTDISTAMALPLKWSISFKYSASDKALDVLTCKSPEEKMILRHKSPDEIGEKIYEGGTGRYELECTVKSIEISPTGGKIDIEFPCVENIVNLLNFDAGAENDIYLVKTDGSLVPVSLNGWSGKCGEVTGEISLRLAYRQPKDFFRNYMDISDVCALSFNGVEYPVE